MPWKCPACLTSITHTEALSRPAPDTVYRCHVCRLELVVDSRTGRLEIAPPPERRESTVQRA
jgi:hypothetical protein